MAPRKLSDADKQAAVERYKQPGETTSTIAAHFGVSNSTVSRLLKLLLPEAEYAELRSQKRSGSADRSKASSKAASKAANKSKPVTKPVKSKPVKSETAAVEVTEAVEVEVPKSPQVEAPESPQASAVSADPELAKPKRRSRRRSSAPVIDQLSLMAAEEAKVEKPDVTSADEGGQSQLSETGAIGLGESDDRGARGNGRDVVSRVPVAADGFDDEDDLDEDDLVDEDDLDDLDDDLEDDLDDGDDDGADTPLTAAIQIMPLTDTALPLTCYLVIDRLSELITRPLKEFAELAEIPSTEQSARTLPVFDNHRVARRFSRRNQRVIKVPNGQLLTKTRPYLQAKGINHLLIDGTLYSLMGD